MADKNYVGSGFEKVFDNGGSVINCRVKVTDLPVDADGFIKIVVGKKRDPKPGSSTHWVAEDTFVPVSRAKNESEPTAPTIKPEDLPF